MASFLKLIVTLTALVCLVSAVPLASVEIPPPVGILKFPHEDDFYSAPHGYENATLGSILRHRRVPNPLSLDNKIPLQVKDAWQIQYRSQNSIGEAEAAIVTVLVPYNFRPGNLFVYGYYTLSPSPLCSQSIVMQIGTRNDSAALQAQAILLVQALNEGYIVSVADDTGPRSSFSAGPGSAYRTLDSIRALKQSGNITGLSKDPIITMTGYSNGGTVTAWTTEIQPQYAPDVKFVGAALGGIIPNATYLMEAHNNKSWSMMGPPTILGLSHDYKNLSKWLEAELIPAFESTFRIPERSCFANYYDFDEKDSGVYLKRGFKSIWDPVPATVIEYGGTLGLRGPPKTPWFLYTSIGDDASPTNLTDALYEKHCKNGASIYYERNITPLDHKNEAMYAYSSTMTWLNDRHNGKPLASGCKLVPVSVDLTWLGGLNNLMDRYNDSGYRLLTCSHLSYSTITVDWLQSQRFRNS